MNLNEFSRMPTTALRILGFASVIIVFLFPFLIAYERLFREIVSIMGAIVLDTLFICPFFVVLPVVVSVVIHYLRAKQAPLWRDLIISVLIPAIAFLPQMAFAYDKLFGNNNFRLNGKLNIISALLLTTLYINLSIIFRNNKSKSLNSLSGALPFFALFAASLINFLFPFFSEFIY